MPPGLALLLEPGHSADEARWRRVFYVYVRPGILRFFGKIDTTAL
jgi:hypothetical protein